MASHPEWQPDADDGDSREPQESFVDVSRRAHLESDDLRQGRAAKKRLSHVCRKSAAETHGAVQAGSGGWGTKEALGQNVPN